MSLLPVIAAQDMFSLSSEIHRPTVVNGRPRSAGNLGDGNEKRKVKHKTKHVETVFQLPKQADTVSGMPKQASGHIHSLFGGTDSAGPQHW